MTNFLWVPLLFVKGGGMKSRTGQQGMEGRNRGRKTYTLYI